LATVSLRSFPPNGSAPRQESTPHPPRNFSFSVLKLTDCDNQRGLNQAPSPNCPTSGAELYCRTRKKPKISILATHKAHELSKNARLDREEQSTVRPRWTERSKVHCGPVKVPSLTRAGPRGANYTAASTQFGLEGCVFVSKSNWKVSDAERGRDWTMAASKG
jgi:hypothetical protein